MERISMFCGVENYVLRYKSVYYKVITDYVERIQYSVFSLKSATIIQYTIKGRFMSR